MSKMHASVVVFSHTKLWVDFCITYAKETTLIVATGGEALKALNKSEPNSCKTANFTILITTIYKNRSAAQ